MDVCYALSTRIVLLLPCAVGLQTHSLRCAQGRSRAVPARNTIDDIESNVEKIAMWIKACKQR